MLERIKQWFRGGVEKAEEKLEEEPVATPPGGEERETSTNAQMGGAADEPWPGNR